MSGRLKTAVLGATGYAGAELTKLLLAHPLVEQPILLRRNGNGRADSNLDDLFPAHPDNGYQFHPLDWPALKQQGVELLFCATPHEVSRSVVPEAAAEGLRVIDLSGAWRLREERNRAIYEFRDEDAVIAAELERKAVYGLPELNGDRIPEGRVRVGSDRRILCL